MKMSSAGLREIFLPLFFFIMVAVFLNELLALHKHATISAAGIAAFVWLQHLYEESRNTSMRVELSTFLSFGKCKLSEEIFKHAAKHILTLCFPFVPSVISKNNPYSEIAIRFVASQKAFLVNSIMGGYGKS
jgi:hypothetical protein